MNFEQNFLGKMSPSKVYAITSGKGGVGKTFIAINLSITFARVGMRVLLIDADVGLANVDVMTGISAPHTIEDVINEEVSIFDVLVEGPENVTILPAGSGLGSIGEMNEQGLQFKKELLKLRQSRPLLPKNLNQHRLRKSRRLSQKRSSQFNSQGQ